jgi:rod shape-determining protein MreD
MTKILIKQIIFYIILSIIIVTKFLSYKIDNITNYFPALEICFIYFFYTYLEEKISYFFVFIISLLFDALTLSNIGTHGLIYFVVFAAIYFQRKIFLFKNFTEIWVLFIVFLIEFNIVQNFIFSFNKNYNFDFIQLLTSCIITILVYPIMHNIFLFLHKNLYLHNKNED